MDSRVALIPSFLVSMASCDPLPWVWEVLGCMLHKIITHLDRKTFPNAEEASCCMEKTTQKQVSGQQPARNWDPQHSSLQQPNDAKDHMSSDTDPSRLASDGTASLASTRITAL